MITVVTAQGVGERLDQPTYRMCEIVCEQLPPGFLEYPVLGPTVGPVGVNPGPSLAASLERCEEDIVAGVEATTLPVVLLGYSGGALAAGNVARDYAAGRYPHLDIRGVALIADPGQPRGVGGDGYGVHSDRQPGIPAMWAYDRRDPICCAGDPSPLHTLSDQLTAMSFGAPDVWAQDLLDRLTAGRWQPTAIDWTHPLATLRRYQRAINQTQYYLSGGHYTAYAGDWTSRITQWIGGIQ